MRACQDMRRLPRVREGVLSSPGLGAMGRTQLSRELMQRRLDLRQAWRTGRRPGIMRGSLRAPLRVRGGGQLAGLYGDRGDPGLGKLRLGKKLKKLGKKVGKVAKKVVKSKAFKYAAIATAAWFTGGLALKAAPALLGKGKVLGLVGKGAKKLLSRKNRESIASAAQAYGATTQVPTMPGSEADSMAYYDASAAAPGYGGGGGEYGGYQAAGFAPGMTEEQEVTEAEGRAAGAGQAASNLLPALAIGIPIFLMLAGSSGARGRRR